MSGSYISRTRKIPALILCVLLSAVMLFSAFYIIAEAHHDCCGKDCPICVCIHQCERTLQQLGSGITETIAVYISAVLALLFVCSGSGILMQETPVSRKVRLND